MDTLNSGEGPGLSWIAISDRQPSGDVLIFADGQYYLAVLIADPPAPGFVDIHSCDLLPWPSHWMALPDPPTL